MKEKRIASVRRAYIPAIALVLLVGCTANLNPADNSVVINIDPSASYCINDCLWIEKSNGVITRSYLKFDLSMVSPAIGTVSSAKLKLHTCQDCDPAGAVLEVYEVLGFWDCASVSWAAQPPIGPTPEDQVLCSGATYVEFDVTALVQLWANTPSANNGLVLKVDETGADSFFSFFEYIVYPQPELIINYMP